jgi:hypothetical protein
MKSFLVVVTAIFAVFSAFLAYYGAFAPVVVSQQHVGPLWLVCEKHVGSYAQVKGPMERMQARLMQRGVSTTSGFGLYFDNPQEVSKEHLRSLVGCIVESEELGLIDSLRRDFTVLQYPGARSLQVSFPFKGGISVFVGMLRVYPILTNYIKNNGLSIVPMLEIYDVPHQEIRYVASVELSADHFERLWASEQLHHASLLAHSVE